ncbi:MAG: transporter related [Acidimicrobiales bacterium]|jgi:ABC-type branched-subunit amino acid transport system ATPase component/ABC-type branched-subunit amino acid transport system permease subunit|nr:transporter related [Acidimicrobiales bacterium]
MLGGAHMIGSIFTANLLFIGIVRGLITALVAMGIVLVYRSNRVINFAVGDMGVPAAALLAVMAGKHHWPFWPALIAALLVGTLTGTVVELGIVRRLFKAPRVIVLVATIGVAELCQAVTRALPDYRTGSLQTEFPSPITSQWQIGSVTVRGPQLLVLIVVPLITIGMWWLLGHTRFGESVRASVANPDLARLTGISPKLVSTAVWSIAGFLSAMAVILIATESTSADLVLIGPSTLLRGLAAALVGRMVSFPKAVVAAVVIGLVDQVLFFNFTNETGLVQFVLFVAVVFLVARVSRRTDTGGESFQFAPRVHVVPDRLKEIWWVRRMPQLIALTALGVAVVLPLVLRQSARHFTYTEVLAFAICATSVTILTGWGGQLSLGQMAFAGIGAVSAAALVRGTAVNIGIGDFRILKGTLPHVPFVWALLLGAVIACLVATIVGAGALRVRGLLLAASTLAFAIAANAYIFRRPFFSLGRQTVQLPRHAIGPIDITVNNRALYYVVLGVLAVLLLVMSRLRRSGIGRTIVGVRENEQAAAALTVSPAKAKLTAYAVGGFVAGLGGALLGALAITIGFNERFFRVEDSIALVSMAVIGGVGSLAGAVMGAVWVIGLPAFWPSNDTVPLFTSSIGLLIILLYLPGGFTQIGYWIRDQLLARVEKRLGPAPQKASAEPPTSLHREATLGPPATNADGSVLSAAGLTVAFGGIVAVDHVDFHAGANQVVGLIGSNGAGKSTLLNAIGGFVGSDGTVQLLGHDVSGRDAHDRARLGLGRTFQAATLFPELTVREVVELALEARHRSSFWSTALFLPSSTRLERQRHAQAAELIDFLGLGRYADRFIAELSTGTRRIVELCALLAVAPRVICLDEPTAGVAQREAEAFGPLIKRIQTELDATLVIVEHDLPLILAISDRVYCMEAGRVIAEGSPADVRADPLVVASYLGTDDRAVLRSNAQV